MQFGEDTPMKTARITFLGSDTFKAQLESEARQQKISVAELIRQQFDRRPGEEEQVLSALAKELKRSTAETRAALNEALAEVNKTLKRASVQDKAA